MANPKENGSPTDGLLERKQIANPKENGGPTEESI